MNFGVIFVYNIKIKKKSSVNYGGKVVAQTSIPI